MFCADIAVIAQSLANLSRAVRVATEARETSMAIRNGIRPSPNPFRGDTTAQARTHHLVHLLSQSLPERGRLRSVTLRRLPKKLSSLRSRPLSKARNRGGDTAVTEDLDRLSSFLDALNSTMNWVSQSNRFLLDPRTLPPRLSRTLSRPSWHQILDSLLVWSPQLLKM